MFQLLDLIFYFDLFSIWFLFQFSGYLLSFVRGLFRFLIVTGGFDLMIKFRMESQFWLITQTEATSGHDEEGTTNLTRMHEVSTCICIYIIFKISFRCRAFSLSLFLLAVGLSFEYVWRSFLTIHKLEIDTRMSNCMLNTRSFEISKTIFTQRFLTV